VYLCLIVLAAALVLFALKLTKVAFVLIAVAVVIMVLHEKKDTVSSGMVGRQIIRFSAEGSDGINYVEC
jgi:hypothetical protein